MTHLYSPDEVPEFSMVRPISQAVMLQEYIDQLEDEIKRVRAMKDEACLKAKESGNTETDEWKLQVRYASGTSKSPDITMLEVEDPAAYGRLYEEQLKSWKPKLTKTDMDWLYEDKDQRKEMMDRISVEHMVRPQYILLKKEVE